MWWKLKGKDNKIEETEDLEQLETIAAEQSQQHTGGTKPDKDDQHEQDNKKQCFAESNSTFHVDNRNKKANESAQ